MGDARWDRLRALFDEARGLSDAERRSLLDERLAGESALRDELEELLAADATARGFLTSPAEGAPRTGPASTPAATVGPYRLLRVLGEGGFGVVHLAEQLHPIRRQVALKLIKPGMDTRQVIARFETERQALALMDHPGIAQIFDAGETEAGRPYFAMEYVPGAAITAYSDDHRLGIRARLDLFLRVCDAVQHAHQKGVIHRDLKPSNVLVAPRDGEPALKIIDFGIVKAAGVGMDDRSIATREGAILGTLGYMSPEQAGATEAVVDTRTDIYALGVLLYELLAGVPPFDPVRLRRASFSDAVRVIREEDPPALTARLAQLGQTNLSGPAASVAEIAGRRSLDERSLARTLKGELEWITMRALEKDPERRYASASELAADVRRYLSDQPVLAGAPSTVYRMRKFARRHRGGVAAAALVTLAIVAGGIAAGIGLIRAARAERVARQEADSARRVSDFLVEMFQTADPNRSRGETITARTLLDQGTRRARASLGQDPRVRVRLLTTLGNAHLSLGLFDEGLALLREALATSEAARPRDDLEIAGQLRELAAGLHTAGVVEEVEPLLDRSIAAATKAGGPRSSAVAACYAIRGEICISQGRLARADSSVTLAIELFQSDVRPDTLQLVRLFLIKARVAHRRYRLEEAERHYLSALELSRKIGYDPNTSMLHSQLALLYATKNEPDSAVSHAGEGLRLARLLYPPDHPNIAIALGGEAWALKSQGKNGACVARLEESVQVLRGSGGREDLLAAGLDMLGSEYLGMRRLDLALARAEEACAISTRILGRENPRTADRLCELAKILSLSGRMDRADSIYSEAIPVLERMDTESIYAANAFMSYGTLCRDNGRWAKADSLLSRSMAITDTAQAAARPFAIECIANHGYLRAMQGRHAEAESLLQEGLAIARRDDAEFSAHSGPLYLLWAAAHVRAGRGDQSIEALRKALRCGVTREDVAAYGDLVSLESRHDYPDSLRTLERDDRAARAR